MNYVVVIFEKYGIIKHVVICKTNLKYINFCLERDAIFDAVIC